MPRTVPEWIGKTDDEPFPPRVRLRILRRFNFRCAGQCGGRLIVPGERWTCDHVRALINGGENRESNGQPLCALCNPEKNRADVAEKSKTASVAISTYGLKTSSRPIDGSRNTRFKKRMDGRVELRPGYERRA